MLLKRACVWKDLPLSQGQSVQDGSTTRTPNTSREYIKVHDEGTSAKECSKMKRPNTTSGDAHRGSRCSPGITRSVARSVTCSVAHSVAHPVAQLILVAVAYPTLVAVAHSVAHWVAESRIAESRIAASWIAGSRIAGSRIAPVVHSSHSHGHALQSCTQTWSLAQRCTCTVLLQPYGAVLQDSNALERLRSSADLLSARSRLRSQCLRRSRVTASRTAGRPMRRHSLQESGALQYQLRRSLQRVAHGIPSGSQRFCMRSMLHGSEHLISTLLLFLGLDIGSLGLSFVFRPCAFVYFDLFLPLLLQTRSLPILYIYPPVSCRKKEAKEATAPHTSDHSGVRVS